MKNFILCACSIAILMCSCSHEIYSPEMTKIRTKLDSLEALHTQLMDQPDRYRMTHPKELSIPIEIAEMIEESNILMTQKIMPLEYSLDSLQKVEAARKTKKL
jgi:hypothetical protein